jgi:hypothetical protein
MPDDQPAKNAQLGSLLADLLADVPTYRELWEPRVRQRSTQRPNRAAVARVIADYLGAAGERADSRDLYRQIKDRVGRALNGDGMSTETLSWFIAAFDIDASDRSRLRDLYGRHHTGDGPAIGEWDPRPVPLPSNRDWHTISLHELHTVGPDGLPESHRTIQVIKARVDGLSAYLYRFDTMTARVRVIRGGTAGPLEDLGDGLAGLHIHTRELSTGQTASLEYETIFDYRDPPPPEFRRSVIRRIDNLEVGIRFQPDRLPRRIVWGSWTDLNGPIHDSRPVHLDVEYSCHHYLNSVERTIIGYSWL